MKKFAWIVLLGTLFGNTAFAERVVVLTPDAAEIVAELGAADKVVAVHDHNHHAAYQGKPTIGFYRNLSPEPIVAQKPDLVVGSFMALPPGIYARLKQSGIQAENVGEKETIEHYLHGIKRLGVLLNKTAAANRLAHNFQAAIQAKPKTGKRYLLSYDGRYVAGRGTVADTLIQLAGGINAADVQGIKPLSREAWLAAKPDVVIIAKHNESMVGGAGKMAMRPELSGSPAAKHHKILFWNADDFLRFGLGTPQHIQRLHELAK